MSWVVDTCLLIDVALADPAFGKISASLIDSRQKNGLSICPVSYVEFAPVFKGDETAQQKFLTDLGISWSGAWLPADTSAAHAVWAKHVADKRAGMALKAPIADILIGAFALRFDGLLTRDPKRFRAHFPSLLIETP